MPQPVHVNEMDPNSFPYFGFMQLNNCGLCERIQFDRTV